MMLMMAVSYRPNPVSGGAAEVAFPTTPACVVPLKAVTGVPTCASVATEMHKMNLFTEDSPEDFPAGMSVITSFWLV